MGLLTQDQRDLFFTLVEASRSSKDTFRARPRSNRVLIGQHALPDCRITPALLDLLAIKDMKYIAVAKRQGEIFTFYISPAGQQAYADLRAGANSPAEQVERDIERFIDADDFRAKYPNAHARWTKASEVLWSANPEGHLSEVGHYCREAMQEFAEELLAEHQLTPNDPDKQHTVARIKQLLTAKKPELGETVSALLDAMLAYWGTVADLSQRQEHAAQKEGEELKWGDARRLVFQTLISMYEVSDTLKRR